MTPKKTLTDAAPPGGVLLDAKAVATQTKFFEQTTEAIVAGIRKKPEILSQLAALAQIDESSELAELSIGAIADQILSRPLDEQKAITTVWAQALGIDAPSHEHDGAGRPTQGLKQLAEVIYPKSLYPLDHEKIEGSKDTRASKRLGFHRRRYRQAQAPRQDREKPDRTEEAKINERALRAVLTVLWAHASDYERRVLITLCKRVGIDRTKLYKWLGEEFLDLASAPLEAIDVTPKRPA